MRGIGFWHCGERLLKILELLHSTCDRSVVFDIPGQLAVDPNAAQVLATDELDDAHASTSDHTRHAQRLKKHIKRAHKKAVLRVANTAAKVLRKSLLVEKIEVPETVEFQELIYLYCAKPSEMKKAKHEEGPLVGGDRAIMANLSEPQLQHFIARHPGSLIESVPLPLPSPTASNQRTLSVCLSV